MKMLGALPAVLLLLLLVAAVWGKLATYFDSCESETLVKLQFDTTDRQLFVMVPGLRGPDKSRKQWHKLARELGTRGDVAMVDYPADPLSNARAELIAQEINQQVQGIWAKKQYQRVVLVGNSMGALLARKALLYSQGAADDRPQTATAWSDKVQRLVLLAGMNRGWDLSGEKPADMRWYVYYAYAAGVWFANLTHSGQLLLQMESGAPFVADLRLEWMRWARSPKAQHLETVQLLGDIDEVVSADDNADLRVSGQGKKFVWLKVRGTSHADVLNISEPKENLGQYRLEKFLSAVDLPFADLQEHSEELPYTTDDAVTHIVFVMHGIRDLGEWSSRIETRLQTRVRAQSAAGGAREKLAIASVRYGYFGMGQFLLRRDRQKYVRWFMDQYTETLARYPHATKIDFIGHSNGTYLLGGALQKYPSMKIRRVVLGGSVLPQDYCWKSVFERKQVELVRNYVADDDWVVALFPRFFEPVPMRWLGNDIGSAGFNGFDAGEDGPGRQAVDNVKFIQGRHAAFLEQLDPIVDFLIPPAGALEPRPTAEGREPKRSSPVLNWMSKGFTPVLWFGLVFIIVWLGSRVSGAAGHLGGLAFVLYVILVFQMLRWI
jgi:pimeloyl-ACP methyl ester carboxylesterase